MKPFLFLIFMFFHNCAFCCSTKNKSLELLLDKANIVMVVKITKSFLQERENEKHTPISAEYELIERIKGNPLNVKKLISGLGYGDCGVGLAPGHYFLIISDDSVIDNKLGAWIYEGTEDMGIENPTIGKSISRVRVDAIRKYIKTGSPIDSCFNWVVVKPPLFGKEAVHCSEVLESAYSKLP